jgi:glutaminyl-tRNA synthetase
VFWWPTRPCGPLVREIRYVLSFIIFYVKANGNANFRTSYIHWVAKCPSKNSPVKATVRVFNPLFKSDDPNTRPDGFLSDVNPRSEEIFPNAMIETGIEEIKRTAPWPRPREGHNEAAPGITPPETVRFQGMRVAYFCLDRDRSEANLVLNRIVSLKEDAKKA